MVVNPMNNPSPNIPALPKRRLLISEPGTNGLPLDLGGLSPLPKHEPAKPPQDIHDRKGEARRIVKRLLAIIEEHRTAALRMNFFFDTNTLDVVLRALEAETHGEDPSARHDGGNGHNEADHGEGDQAPCRQCTLGA